jgi:flagellar basal body-associated protein FliL
MDSTNTKKTKTLEIVIILVLAFMALFAFMGLVVLLASQSMLDNPKKPLLNSLTPTHQDELVITPDPINLTNTPNIQTHSTKIIAPLLSFSESINSQETHTYIFQAISDTSLIINLETNYDIKLQVQIVNKDNEPIYTQEVDRGKHEILFTPNESGEYSIKVICNEGQGDYNIGMIFAIKDGEKA